MILDQVNRIVNKRYALNNLFRLIHKEARGSNKLLYPLENRKLLKVKGDDASLFLQGLITNDMRHFEEGARSMYAMFLNNKGRVMYDTLIHKWNEENAFLIECDKNVLSLLQRHLKLYKLKRLIELQDINEHFRLWALIAPLDSLTESMMDSKQDVSIYKDPRLADLGFRVISRSNLDGPCTARNIGDDIVSEMNEDGYKLLRYRLGVSEGAEDLPPGTCFPLEANCDYLHGVSFHKGCYIGQEVTARVHHTGVVRKRVMPLQFSINVTENIKKDTIITAVDNPKLNIGKFKVVLNNFGLGLVRIKEAIDSKVLSIGDYKVTTFKPEWWPKEAPKEKINLKNE